MKKTDILQSQSKKIHRNQDRCLLVWFALTPCPFFWYKNLLFHGKHMSYGSGVAHLPPSQLPNPLLSSGHSDCSGEGKWLGKTNWSPLKYRNPDEGTLSARTEWKRELPAKHTCREKGIDQPREAETIQETREDANGIMLTLGQLCLKLSDLRPTSFCLLLLIQMRFCHL